MENPWVLLTAYLFFSKILILQASASTNSCDVTILQDLYKSLNQPPQLVGWKFSGGDHNDVNFNHIDGEIPSSLPPNATHIDLSFNNFNQNIPFSLTSMKYLRHLNPSHNSLSGPVGNVFIGLPDLKQMILTYNNFKGDLPSSFTSLMNLTGLFLQNNQFTVPVVFLAYLPLTDLNIQITSAVLFQSNLKIYRIYGLAKMNFKVEADYSPWSFPTDNIPTDQNVKYFPKAQSNAIESYPISREGKQKQKRSTPGAIAFTCLFIGSIRNATFQSMRRLRQATGCNWRDWKAVGIKAEGRPPLQPVQKSEVYYKCSGCGSEIVKYTAVTFINEIHGLRFHSPNLQVDPLETVHVGAYGDTLLSPAVGFILIFHLQCNSCQQELGHLYRAPKNNETWVLTRHLLRLP